MSDESLGTTESWAWMWAFLCPPLGLAYGIALLDKKPGKGAQVIVASVALGGLYVVLWATR